VLLSLWARVLQAVIRLVYLMVPNAGQVTLSRFPIWKVKHFIDQGGVVRAPAGAPSSDPVGLITTVRSLNRPRPSEFAVFVGFQPAGEACTRGGDPGSIVMRSSNLCQTLNKCVRTKGGTL
jgi:hypothetical protein